MISKKSVYLRYLFSAAIAIIILYLLFSYLGIESLYKILDMPLVYFALVCLSSYLIALIVCYRWKLIIHSLYGVNVRLIDLLDYYLLGRIFSYVVPKDIGEFGTRTVMLCRKNLTLKQTLFSIIVDRFFDLLEIGLFLVPAILFLSGLINLTSAIILLFASLLFSLISIACFGSRLVSVGFRLAYRIKSFFSKTSAEYKALIIPNDKLSVMYLLSVFRFFILISRYYVLFLAYQISFPYISMMLATPLAQASYLVAFTPAGLGVFEAGWMGVLLLFGLAKADIALFLVAQRALFLVAVIISYLSNLALKRILSVF